MSTLRPNVFLDDESLASLRLSFSPSSLPPRLITCSPRRRRTRHATGSDLDAMGRVRFVNRFAGSRFGRGRRIPVFVQDAAVGRTAMVNHLAASIFIVFAAAAGVASRAAAEIAAQPRKDSASAAIIGTVAGALENPGKAGQTIRLAASSATASEVTALAARIAAIRRIADPFAPVDVAATLTAGGPLVEPPLEAAVVAADGLAAGSALKIIALCHPLLIGPAEERTPTAAARPATAPAHILTAAAAGQKCGSTNPHSPPGNHREVL